MFVIMYNLPLTSPPFGHYEVPFLKGQVAFSFVDRGRVWTHDIVIPWSGVLPAKPLCKGGFVFVLYRTLLEIIPFCRVCSPYSTKSTSWQSWSIRHNLQVKWLVDKTAKRSDKNDCVLYYHEFFVWRPFRFFKFFQVFSLGCSLFLVASFACCHFSFQDWEVWVYSHLIS